MEQNWVFIAGAVLLGLVGLLATAKAILERVAPTTPSTKDDEWVQRLQIAENAVRAIAAAIGVDVKEEDTPQDVVRKVQQKK